MNKEGKIRTGALIAGGVVGLGILYFGIQKQRKCKEYPGIWTDKNKLHLTQEAQDKALESARAQIRSALLADSPFDVGEIQLKTASEVTGCESWTDKDTEKSRQVWEGIGSIVKHVIDEAKNNPEAFYEV